MVEDEAINSALWLFFVPSFFKRLYSKVGNWEIKKLNFPISNFPISNFPIPQQSLNFTPPYLLKTLGTLK
jgi:hypothetical protein